MLRTQKPKKRTAFYLHLHLQHNIIVWATGSLTGMGPHEGEGEFAARSPRIAARAAAEALEGL